MKTLYESLLDDEDVVSGNIEKIMAQRKMIEDIGLWEVNPATSGGNSAEWLKQLPIKTDYTSLFKPFVKKNKNWFNKYSKEYSALVGVIFNVLLLVKRSHREIYVWDETSTGPRPDGLEYMEKYFRKQYHRDVVFSCADMLDDGIIVIRLEIYDVKSSSFTYIYFEEDKFDKYIN
jgi:hypothetical protein